jgi:hypothetical protein
MSTPRLKETRLIAARNDLLVTLDVKPALLWVATLQFLQQGCQPNDKHISGTENKETRVQLASPEKKGGELNFYEKKVSDYNSKVQHSQF